ncbi:MAG: MgtC/SapB family protein, partial [Bdellovibrionia bacterium]
MDQWQPYLIAVVIGLLVGIEREKAHPSHKTMGVRTFLLVSLLGAVAGGFQNVWLAALLAAFALSLIVVSYFIQASAETSDDDRGLTTEFAAGLIFSLGFLAHQSPSLAALLGPLVAVILFSKKTLHQFTHAIKPTELEAALLILLAGVVVIDLAPNQIVDPWGIFNPRKFGYLILTLAVLEFLSYVLVKALGEKKGAFIVGICGGFVSSTAVLLSMARQANKQPEHWRILASSAVAAKFGALIELALIVGLVSPSLLKLLAWPVTITILSCLLGLVLLARKRSDRKPSINLRSPLDWRGVLRLSITLGAILAIISMAERWLGSQATFVISFLTGLFELHGVSLATA